MSKKIRLLIIFLFLSFFLMNITSCAWFLNRASNINLSTLFSDNMVLQRDAKVSVWGTADPGGNVNVEIAGQRRTTEVAEDGNWKIEFEPMPVGGPHELTVIGQETIIYKNVMIGEVWICSGQSNMQMPINSQWGKVINSENEVATASYPNIRLLSIKRTTSTVPVDTITSSGWEQCSPGTIAEFSATAYFFGRHLYNNLNIPIGLIHSSWGGTVAEAWTSPEALKTLPDFMEEVELLISDTTSIEDAIKEYNTKLKIREQKIVETDAGFRNGKYIWNTSELDLSDWGEMKLPTLWENAGYKNLDGVVWFRKKVNIPLSMNAKNLNLHLGPINDDDITWFNGVKVGATNGVGEFRKYKIPGSIVNTGVNVIAIRVFDMGNNGGLYGQSDQLKITDDSGKKISLAGPWNYKIGLDVDPVPKSPVDPNRPTVLYNAMIHPLLPFTIRGAIWYQGESNAGRAFQYRTLFPTMITDWRSHWNQGDFPFYFVQLANFMQPKSEPVDDAWAELREAQLMTLSLPNTGMAVTIDIGEALDIHPRNKQDVGRRLALNALNLIYDQKIENSGPLYKSMKIEGSKIRLTFDHIDSGLEAKDSKLIKGFAIAGDNKKFYWASGKIDGSTVVVSSRKVIKPVAVRYAWAANPICNLYNKAGLPASPFRTDSWEGITVGNK